MSGDFCNFAVNFEQPMPAIQLHIVGFPYRKDIEGHVSEFLADAPGHTMTVRVQRDNEVDSRAIRAYDWQGRHVGFVSRSDLPKAWGAMRCSGRKSLRGTIVSTDIEHPCAVFECTAPSDYKPDEEIYQQAELERWSYSGPMLSFPEELDSLDYMMDEITDRLAERQDWTGDDADNFLKLLERYASISIYDISGETSDYRLRLIRQLQQSGVAELEPVTEELRRAAGRTGRETAGGTVLNYWIGMMQSDKMLRSLLVHQHLYDAKVVEEELKCFPDDLYFEWQRDREHFVSKLFYRHIPREVLWRFVSGIAFVEMAQACEAAVSKQKEEKAPSKPVNVILTGEHAKYIEGTESTN